MELIAFGSHKHYTLASVEEATGRIVCERRIAHERGTIFGLSFGTRTPGHRWRWR
jgi:hypothetical protein